MEKVVLKANIRNNRTKSDTKIIRKNSRVPGVFYLKNHDTLSIDVPESSINPLVYTADTHVISLQIDGYDEFECVIKDVQFDPVSDKVVHFDLLGLTKGEKFQLEVPLRFQGSPIGVKEGGIIQQVLHKLEIECLPKDIPQHLDINITELKLGDSLHVKDVSFPDLTILNPEDSVIVAITHPKVEVEKTTEEILSEEEAQPELIGKEKEEEE